MYRCSWLPRGTTIYLSPPHRRVIAEMYARPQAAWAAEIGNRQVDPQTTTSSSVELACRHTGPVTAIRITGPTGETLREACIDSRKNIVATPGLPGADHNPGGHGGRRAGDAGVRPRHIGVRARRQRSH